MKTANRILGTTCVVLAATGASVLSHAADAGSLSQPGLTGRHIVLKPGQDLGSFERDSSQREVPSANAGVGKYGLFEAPEHDDRRPRLYDPRGDRVRSTDALSYGEQRPVPFRH